MRLSKLGPVLMGLEIFSRNLGITLAPGQVPPRGRKRFLPRTKSSLRSHKLLVMDRLKLGHSYAGSVINQAI